MFFRKLTLFTLLMWAGNTFGFTVSGYVTDATSGEVLNGAYVITTIQGVGAVTNQYGFYSMQVPENEEFTIKVKYFGFSVFTQTLALKSDLALDISLKPSENEIETLVIKSPKKTSAEAEVKSNKMSVTTLTMKQLKNIPSMGGEVDILKVAQLLPGVSRGSEGGTGMFVRGGDADQNLVILDEATVYNVGHLFGFFSVFNPDAIKDITMIKGAFPAQYGGRLSSVLDIRSKDGNRDHFSVEGGIGLLSSRLTVEGPIIKDKMSFLISGRRTYIDQVFKLANVDVPYYFYDLNAKVNYVHDRKNKFFLSSYFGDDVLKLSEQVDDSSGNFGFGFNLGNFTQTLRWNHLFDEKTFSNLSLIHTNFNYDINGSFVDNNILIKSRVRDLGLKYMVTKFQSNDMTVKFGAETILHNFKPNVVSTSGEISEYLKNKQGDLLQTFESAIYANVTYDIDSMMSVEVGSRLSSSFVPGKMYPGLEPRISVKRLAGAHGAFKMSYSRMFQYMHRVSSSSVALPTDLWYPITANIKPQRADQIAAGYHLYVPKLKSSLSIEGYYKWMNNLIEYKEGTNLVLNDNFEESLIQGEGSAYGGEFLLKKDFGRLTGWVGYTLSWSKRKFDGLNGGKEFWARFDRRHDISVVGNYEINKRSAFSVVWVFSNGSRFTPLLGQYVIPNAGLSGADIIPVYADRNSVSMTSSHRLDVNYVIKRKKKKRFMYEWHLGAYNVYNRASPFTIRVEPDGSGGYQYSQPGLFGFIPSVAFNFSF